MISDYDIVLWFSGFLGGVGISLLVGYLVLRRPTPDREFFMNRARRSADKLNEMRRRLREPKSIHERDPDWWKGDHS